MTLRTDSIPSANRLRIGLASVLTVFLMASCASEVTPTETWPKEVQLAVGQGVVFSVGEAVPGASHLKVDLLVYKRGQSNYDVKSGAADGFNRMPMNTFKSGGVRQTFASLDDVPAKLPGNDNQDEFVDRVKTGNGMVVMNNIGDGHTKVWVKQVIASAGLVVLQFEPIPAK